MRLDQSSIDLIDLKQKVENGVIDVQPSFQRGEVWAENKKRRLIDTIIRQWYIPAIHIVVNDDLDREEVLDGQQRVRAVLEFFDDAFPVDGHLEPYSPTISDLHGMYYSDLPQRIRSQFNRYSLGTVRLRDYEPEEPGELFFRLNQVTSLNAAEQRNALIGEPRNQVKRLSQHLDHTAAEASFGFSNSRLNYDDVLSRLVFSLEAQTLSIKIGAKELEERYRARRPFPEEVMGMAHTAISLFGVAQQRAGRYRQNKATLFSWLHFFAEAHSTFKISDHESIFAAYHSFEASRATSTDSKKRYEFEELSNHYPINLNDDSILRSCIDIFNNRSTSRVNDVTSILLRDFSLYAAVTRFLSIEGNVLDSTAWNDQVLSLTHSVISMPNDPSERNRYEGWLASQWSDFREIRRA